MKTRVIEIDGRYYPERHTLHMGWIRFTHKDNKEYNFSALSDAIQFCELEMKKNISMSITKIVWESGGESE